MKKQFFLLFSLFSSGFIFSQVGVNTTNPQGIFNIDGNKDNPVSGTPSAQQQLNDFTVLSSGNVGIGTTTPSTKLEIQTGGTSTTPVTGFKLVDGNQSKSYVLTSDSDGVGTWAPVAVSMVKATITTIPDESGNIPFKNMSGWSVRSNASITLGPGTWRVDMTQLLNTGGTLAFDALDYAWLRFSLGDSPTATTISTDVPSVNGRLVSVAFKGPVPVGEGRFTIGSGTMFVTNSSTVDKTYYLMVGDIVTFGTKSTSSDGKDKFFYAVGGNWSENSIIATRMSN